MYICAVFYLFASVGELLYGRVKVSLRIVLKNNYQCLLNPMYRFASEL